jgi:predicted flap endonuclease-1-like 5' DNA nuclease
LNLKDYWNIQRNSVKGVKMNIMKIEGIGPATAERLREQGIATTEALLEVASDKKGRNQLASQTGLSASLILEWVNRADLMRIKGVGEEYSDLLEQAGVDSVKELRRRRPDNLQQTMSTLNQEKQLVRRVPSVSEVERWVEHAKTLPPLAIH